MRTIVELHQLEDDVVYNSSHLPDTTNAFVLYWYKNNKEYIKADLYNAGKYEVWGGILAKDLNDLTKQIQDDIQERLEFRIVL